MEAEKDTTTWVKLVLYSIINNKQQPSCMVILGSNIHLKNFDLIHSNSST